MVTNQSHHHWCQAAPAQGLCETTSNYIFAISKPVAAMLEPFEAQKDRVHMTRGDGSGPENLLSAKY